MSELKWILADLDEHPAVPELVSKLSAREPFPEPLARLLVQRGVDSFEKAREFFSPSREQLHDPAKLKDMDKAVARILRSVEAKETILIYGDYDVDGTTSVSLVASFFEDWGIKYDYYIPDRYSEGYGLSFQGINYANEKGYSLIITLDCGTKALDKVTYAAQRDIDFIICDHHNPGPELPEAVALLNPKREDCSYPFQEMSACVIGLKLVQALTESFLAHPTLGNRFAKYDPLNRFADLVTLSIACDIVPIIDENRAIAHLGLQKIRTSPMPGIKALMDLSDFHRDWDVSDLVFFLGPRINSAGRLGDAKRAVRMLLGDASEMAHFAKELHASNEVRRELDREITQEALEMIGSDPESTKKSAQVLYKKDWHKGVIGIVASRVIESHYKPTILLTHSNGNWVGSGRSVQNFDLYAALQACSEHLLRFGGHKYAAGLTVKEGEIEKFAEKFEAEVSSRILEAQKVPTLEIACQLDFSYILPKFVRLLNRFAPFGPHNPEPIFLSRSVQVTNFRVLKEEHLRLDLEQNGSRFEAIGFNLAKKYLNGVPEKIDIAYQPAFKTWNNRTYIQLRIKDFKAST